MLGALFRISSLHVPRTSYYGYGKRPKALSPGVVCTHAGASPPHDRHTGGEGGLLA